MRACAHAMRGILACIHVCRLNMHTHTHTHTHAHTCKQALNSCVLTLHVGPCMAYTMSPCCKLRMHFLQIACFELLRIARTGTHTNRHTQAWQHHALLCRCTSGAPAGHGYTQGSAPVHIGTVSSFHSACWQLMVACAKERKIISK